MSARFINISDFLRTKKFKLELFDINKLRLINLNDSYREIHEVEMKILSDLLKNWIDTKIKLVIENDGRYSIMDGGHRIAGLIYMYENNRENFMRLFEKGVPMYVFEDLNEVERFYTSQVMNAVHQDMRYYIPVSLYDRIYMIKKGIEFLQKLCTKEEFGSIVFDKKVRF